MELTCDEHLADSLFESKLPLARLSSPIEGHALALEIGAAPILRELDLTLRTGRFCALIGPNGAGKTSLLRSLAGLEERCRGQIQLDGRPLRDLTPFERARLLAYLPAHSDASFHFTVLETVLMARSMYHPWGGSVSELEWELARRCLEATDTWPLASRSLLTLSSGERQRVLLARVFCQHTPLLMLDEPTNFLDLHHQHGLMALLAALCRQQGRTVVCVLHDVRLACEYCDDIVLLDAGRIAAAGTAAQLCSSDALERAYRLSTEKLALANFRKHATVDPQSHEGAQRE